MKLAGKFSPGALNGLILFAAATVLAGCDDLSSKPNVYKLPVSKVWDKLNAAVKPSANGPFGRMEMETSGRRYLYVEWTIKGSPFGHLCIANLKPEGAEQTRVDVSCKNAGEGAAAGLYGAMKRNQVIELVDATLRDRSYDPKKADGATAARWPKDVIDHGTHGTAFAKALEMERKMAEEVREINSGHR